MPHRKRGKLLDVRQVLTAGASALCQRLAGFIGPSASRRRQPNGGGQPKAGVDQKAGGRFFPPNGYSVFFFAGATANSAVFRIEGAVDERRPRTARYWDPLCPYAAGRIGGSIAKRLRPQPNDPLPQLQGRNVRPDPGSSGAVQGISVFDPRGTGFPARRGPRPNPKGSFYNRPT